MERVVFIVEETGERIACLLNPESLVLRRTAGLRTRRTVGGSLAGAGRADDSLLHTGGGRTELLLDLLFDVSLATGPTPASDVRELTGRLWDLAENVPDDEGHGRLRIVRFVWGRAWNILGVVSAVAERLEYFTADGTARRSWMRMRLVRVGEASLVRNVRAPNVLGRVPTAVAESPEGLRTLEVVGPVASEPAGGEPAAEAEPARPDNWAATVWGDPSLWRWLLSFNRVNDALRIPTGTVLQVPPPPDDEGAP